MLTPKTILLSIFSLNVFALLFLSENIFRERSKQTLIKEYNEQESQSEEYKKASGLGFLENRLERSYRFSDPALAYHLLAKLDIYAAIGPKDIAGANYKGQAGGFTVNNGYCDEHRAYFVKHPELVFENMNFVSNYWKTHKLRTQVIPQIGKDMHPQMYPGTKSKEIVKMAVEANIFFSYYLFFKYRQIGKQFSCLTQSSNHIPGHDKMARKDRLGQALVDYASTYSSRPACFNFEKYFPKTWILQQKQQCLDFFKEFNSPTYQKLKEERNVVYFRKIGAGVHEGKGVFPVTTKEEAYIRNLYKNGTLCGKIKNNNLIQYNVHNLLLVENRKPGFRMFLLIASTNPVIAYFHDGYARLSMNEYDAKSNKTETFVTNIGVNLKVAQKGTIFEGMTPAEIQERTSWSLQDFVNYLIQNGLVTDENWLDTYLRPEFKKVMVHLVRMAQSGFFKKSSLFELYGLDFVMDENLNLWFIEANPMPLVDGFTKESTRLMNRMLIDTFEIVMGLQRSRVKRMIKYINELTKEIPKGSSDIPRLEQRRYEFQELTKNYFEPEFEPSPDNTLQLIIDENMSGTERYADLLRQECL